MNLKYLTLLVFISVLNHLSGSVDNKGIHLTLTFDSTFNSEIFEKKTILIGNRELELKSAAADTVNRCEIFHLSDMNKGYCTITIYSVFTETQMITLNLYSDTSIYIKNRWDLVDTFSKADFSLADTIEWISRSWACRTPMVENKYILKRLDQSYWLEKISQPEMPSKDNNDFKQTVYKAKDEINESKDFYEPSSIIDDLFIVQKSIGQYFIEKRYDREILISGGEEIFLKIGNKVVFYFFHVIPENNYHDFSKKYHLE